MTLSRKILIILLLSILFIATINILSFYYFYYYYFKIYLAENINQKNEITQEYINNIIKKQANEEFDKLWDSVDVETKFYDLLKNSNDKIKLDSDENINIVVGYLMKYGVSPKNIEEILPKNYINKIFESLKDKKSPEYIFFKRLVVAVISVNIFGIALIILFLLFISRKIIVPIRQTTDMIKGLKLGKDFRMIHYEKKDEIGLLVDAINGLNIKLNIGENIKNKLLADISHELKTPITSIQLYLEGIKDGVIKLDSKNLDSIIYEMQRLIKLVNKIMEFERFENKTLELNIKPEEIKKLTNEISNHFNETLKITEQKIEIIGDEISLDLDKDLYIQIVQNIISNFIKYAGNGTNLLIIISKNSIIFRDNGKGVLKTELPYIKEKFYQSNREKTGNIEKRGIGIGLSIVEKIVKSLNWRMEIDSINGEYFEIKLIT